MHGRLCATAPSHRPVAGTSMPAHSRFTCCALQLVHEDVQARSRPGSQGRSGASSGPASCRMSVDDRDPLFSVAMPEGGTHPLPTQNAPARVLSALCWHQARRQLCVCVRSMLAIARTKHPPRALSAAGVCRRLVINTQACEAERAADQHACVHHAKARCGVQACGARRVCRGPGARRAPRPAARRVRSAGRRRLRAAALV